MVTMEPPVGFDAGAIRSKKAELLVAIPEVQPSEAVRGQYGAGTVLGKRTNGRLDGLTVVAQHASPASRLTYDICTAVSARRSNLFVGVGAQMKIMRVTPMEEGLEDRTFECSKCHEMDTLVFSAVSGGGEGS